MFPSFFSRSGLTGARVAGLTAAAAALVAAVGLVVYQLRDSIFSNRGLDSFERKYAEQLRARRRQVAQVSIGGGGDASTATALSTSASGNFITSATDGELISGGDSALAGGGSSSYGLSELQASARVKVIYGSETGNAETFAKALVMTLNDRGVSSALVDPSRWEYLDSYTRQHLKVKPLFHFPESASKTPPVAAPSPSSSDPPTEVDSDRGSDILVFVVATTGDGESPANFLTLYQEMQAAVAGGGRTMAGGGSGAVEGKIFSHVKFAVFNLCDRSYKYYARAGMSVHRMMATGGATELHLSGFGDAATGKQEEIFEEWAEGLLQALVTKCGVSLEAGNLSPPPPRMRFVRHAGPSNTDSDGNTAVGDWRGKAAPFPAPLPFFEPTLHKPTLVRLVARERLTPVRDDDGSAVVRLAFSLEGTTISYQAGDHLAVYPPNPPAMVERCARILNLSEVDLSCAVELQEAWTRTTMANALPARVTLWTALTHYPDLCGRPKKATLRVLAKFCADEAEKRAFLVLLEAKPSAAPEGGISATNDGANTTTSDGNNTTTTTTTNPTVTTPTTAGLRTILDYMESFPSCCGGSVPVGHFLEIVPRIRPRYYSIATDRTTHPEEIQIYVRVWPDGLASGYLAHGASVDEGFGQGGSSSAATVAPATTMKGSSGSGAGEHCPTSGSRGIGAAAVVAAIDNPAGPGWEATYQSAGLARSCPEPSRQRQLRWREPSMVFGFVRISTFHLPVSLPPTAPVVMIGPGTGAAAMVGLLYRREALMRRQPATPFGDCLFFFGCRHAASEYFVMDECARWSLAPGEMAAYDAAHPAAPFGIAARTATRTPAAPASPSLASKVVTHLCCAFSRDQAERHHVTADLRAHAELIYDIIVNRPDSMVFLSGDASAMGKDVDRVLAEIIQSKEKKGKLYALRVLQKMEDERRYLKDVY